MQVFTSVFMLEVTVQNASDSAPASTQERISALNAECESKEFVSLYSGKNRIERIDPSPNGTR